MPPRPVTDTTPVADWRDLAHFIISLTLVLGAVACCVVNLCISGKITWALITVAGCITAYVGVCLPMKLRKLLPELSVLFDLLSVLFTVSVIGWYTGSFDWVFRIAFPLSAAFSVCSAYIVNLVRRHRIRYFHICALGAVFAGLLSVLTEILINRGADISWSGIVAISCVCFAAVLCIIAKSRRLTRRFHL